MGHVTSKMKGGMDKHLTSWILVMSDLLLGLVTFLATSAVSPLSLSWPHVPETRVSSSTQTTHHCTSSPYASISPK